MNYADIEKAINALGEKVRGVKIRFRSLFSNKMGFTGFVFEICATKDKVKGDITGLSRCHSDLLRLNNDGILISNNWCFLWYHT